MKDKARANLKASRILIKKSLIDPAMNRLYYALFQAGVHAMGRQGKKPGDYGSAPDWEHGTICGNATVFRRPPNQDFHLFRSARELREQADYTPIPVKQERVAELLPKAISFVEEVCS